MQTLSNGYLLPEDADFGDEFFAAMEQNIQMINDHDHDGVNSTPLHSTEQDILAANWVDAAIGGGLYQQNLTLPGSLQYDDIEMWFRRTTGEVVYPSIEKVAANQYTIYTNDNSISYQAFYR